MEKVKVMIVDDQYIARQLFEMYIKSSEKYKLVMQVDSAALATKALKGNPVDLILMDILMSDGSNGLSAACEIKKIRPEVKIIAVTSMRKHLGLQGQERLESIVSGIKKHQKKLSCR